MTFWIDYSWSSWCSFTQWKQRGVNSQEFTPIASKERKSNIEFIHGSLANSGFLFATASDPFKDSLVMWKQFLLLCRKTERAGIFRLWLYHVQISGLLSVIFELEYVTDGMANTRDIWHKVFSIGRRQLLSPDSRRATYCQQYIWQFYNVPLTRQHVIQYTKSQGIKAWARMFQLSQTGIILGWRSSMRLSLIRWFY